MDRAATSGNRQGSRIMVCKRSGENLNPATKHPLKRLGKSQFRPVQRRRFFLSYPVSSDSLVRELARVLDLRGSLGDQDLIDFGDIRKRWHSRQANEQTDPGDIWHCWGTVGRHIRRAMGAYSVIEELEEEPPLGDDSERAEQRS